MDQGRSGATFICWILVTQSQNSSTSSLYTPSKVSVEHQYSKMSLKWKSGSKSTQSTITKFQPFGRRVSCVVAGQEPLLRNFSNSHHSLCNNQDPKMWRHLIAFNFFDTSTTLAVLQELIRYGRKSPIQLTAKPTFSRRSLINLLP